VTKPDPGAVGQNLATLVVNALCILSCTFGTTLFIELEKSPGPGKLLSGSPTFRSLVLLNGAVLKDKNEIKEILTYASL